MLQLLHMNPNASLPCCIVAATSTSIHWAWHTPICKLVLFTTLWVMYACSHHSQANTWRPWRAECKAASRSIASRHGVCVWLEAGVLTVMCMCIAEILCSHQRFTNACFAALMLVYHMDCTVRPYGNTLCCLGYNQHLACSQERNNISVTAF